MLRIALTLALAVALAPTLAAADVVFTLAPGQVPAVERQNDSRHWEVRLGAGAGAARMAMLGSTHGGVGITIDFEALRWFDRVGVGLYVTELVAEPLMGVMSTRGKPVFRDLAFEIEPELALRRATFVARWLSFGWKVSGSAGIVVARTIEDCASPFSHHACVNVLERSTELGATAGAGVFAHVGPVAVDVGARAQADSAGDGVLAMQASAGAVW